MIYVPTDYPSLQHGVFIGTSAARRVRSCGEKGIATGCGVATISIEYYDLGYAHRPDGAQGADRRERHFRNAIVIRAQLHEKTITIMLGSEHHRPRDTSR